MADQTYVDLAQVVSQQAQLEEMVDETNQDFHTIKQLLERRAIPSAQLTTRRQLAVERLRVKQ